MASRADVTNICAKEYARAEQERTGSDELNGRPRKRYDWATPTSRRAALQSYIEQSTDASFAGLQGITVGPNGLVILITLTNAATALGVWPARVGELELRRRRDDTFALRYRQWLIAA